MTWERENGKKRGVVCVCFVTLSLSYASYFLTPSPFHYLFLFHFSVILSTLLSSVCSSLLSSHPFLTSTPFFSFPTLVLSSNRKGWKKIWKREEDIEDKRRTQGWHTYFNQESWVGNHDCGLSPLSHQHTLDIVITCHIRMWKCRRHRKVEECFTHFVILFQCESGWYLLVRVHVRNIIKTVITHSTTVQ